ncbi:MAG: DUF2197 domain-containing protein [Clostridia bacterium]|nr:DUF2197 domain-containing protein [Clostridia bacterium]
MPRIVCPKETGEGVLERFVLRKHLRNARARVSKCATCKNRLKSQSNQRETPSYRIAKMCENKCENTFAKQTRRKINEQSEN